MGFTNAFRRDTETRGGVEAFGGVERGEFLFFSIDFWCLVFHCPSGAAHPHPSGLGPSAVVLSPP